MMESGIGVQAEGCSVRAEHLYADDSYVNNLGLVSPLTCRHVYNPAAFLISLPGCFQVSEACILSQTVVSLLPCPQPWSFLSVSQPCEPHSHPSGYTGQKSRRQSEYLFLPHTRQYNSCSDISIFLSPVTPASPATIISRLEDCGSQLIAVSATALSASMLFPTCSLSDLFKAQTNCSPPASNLLVGSHCP